MGRIWTMVAGGGASVVYADTIADFAEANGGNVSDLANYGEYSGGPTTGETKFYADTVIDLMTRHKDPNGKRYRNWEHCRKHWNAAFSGCSSRRSFCRRVKIDCCRNRSTVKRLWLCIKGFGNTNKHPGP